MHTVNTNLSGSTQVELQEKMDSYLKSYPSQGYGTFFNKPYFDEKKNMWIVLVTRGNTCD